jgi:hypothetical protein
MTREPQLGDTIRTAKPMNCDSLLNRSGEYMYAALLTPASVEEGKRLVATGRWVVVEEEKEREASE